MSIQIGMEARKGPPHLLETVVRAMLSEYDKCIQEQTEDLSFTLQIDSTLDRCEPSIWYAMTEVMILMNCPRSSGSSGGHSGWVTATYHLDGNFLLNDEDKRFIEASIPDIIEIAEGKVAAERAR